jgi:hypothetical protein
MTLPSQVDGGSDVLNMKLPAILTSAHAVPPYLSETFAHMYFVTVWIMIFSRCSFLQPT